MRTVKLDVGERLTILELLFNSKGNYVTMKHIHELQVDIIGFNDDEIKNYNLKTNEKGILTWNQKGAEELEFKLDDTKFDIIKEKVLKLDESEQLTERHLSLYEKFIASKPVKK